MFARSEQLSETYRKFLLNSNKSPEIPKDSILNIKPGNEILSNALDISKNTARISFGGSQLKFEKISWFIDRSGLHKNRMDKILTN